MLDWNEYLKFLAGLFAIVDPLGSIPLFVVLTANQNLLERVQTARMAALTVGGVLLGVLLSGEPVLSFFGISFGSFQIAGGILLLLMALSMVQAQVSPVKNTQEELEDAESRASVAVVPLGIPLLAGPGAMSAVILYAHRSNHPGHYLVIAGEILLVAFSVWLCFRAAPFFTRWLGRTGINVSTRLMGLIIAALGVEFISNGVKRLFPVF